MRGKKSVPFRSQTKLTFSSVLYDNPWNQFRNDIERITHRVIIRIYSQLQISACLVWLAYGLVCLPDKGNFSSSFLMPKRQLNTFSQVCKSFINFHTFFRWTTSGVRHIGLNNNFNHAFAQLSCAERFQRPVLIFWTRYRGVDYRFTSQLGICPVPTYWPSNYAIIMVIYTLSFIVSSK